MATLSHLHARALFKRLPTAAALNPAPTCTLPCRHLGSLPLPYPLTKPQPAHLRCPKSPYPYP